MARKKEALDEYVSMSSKEIDFLPPEDVYKSLLNDYIKAKDKELNDQCINQILQLALITKRRIEFRADSYDKDYNSLIGVLPATIEDITEDFQTKYNKIKNEKN